MDNVEALQQLYSSKGFRRRVGFGVRPAVLVIDFQKTFTDPKSPLGSDLSSQLQHTHALLTVAREARIPIIFTVGAYDPNSSDSDRLWLKKVPPPEKWLTPGTEWVEVASILERQPDEILIVKKYPSGFFGTDLLSRLTAQRIDTIIVTGCTTSGCVRATVVDGASYEFHVIVVEEAVGDRSEITHRVNLADMDAKYADVVPVDTVVEYLGSNVQRKATSTCT